MQSGDHSYSCDAAALKAPLGNVSTSSGSPETPDWARRKKSALPVAPNANFVLGVVWSCVWNLARCCQPASKNSKKKHKVGIVIPRRVFLGTRQ